MFYQLIWCLGGVYSFFFYPLLSSLSSALRVRPCFSLSISTPRLNREKSFIVYPKVLWESSNQNLNRKQSGKLNPDLLDPGEYVMEKVYVMI